MTTGRLRVLFLCTGNSARSQMAEALLRQISHDRIEVASAGSDPRLEIDPAAREVMERIYRLDLAGQEPKHWERFTGDRFDYVITLCARAAETCPVFPGEPDRIQWHLDDPAAAEGSDAERRRAFERTASDLMARLRIWLALPKLRASLDDAQRGLSPLGRGQIQL